MNTTVSFKTRKGDILFGVLFLVVLSTIGVAVFSGFIGSLSGPILYLVGALKVGSVAPFGTFGAARRADHEWRITPRKILAQVLAWSIFGVWFTFAFPLISGGVDALTAKGLWFDFSGLPGLLGPLLTALGKSVTINGLSGYAWSMMVTHGYVDQLVKMIVLQGTARFGLTDFEKVFDKHFWIVTTPKRIIVFWIGAQTITYLLVGQHPVLGNLQNLQVLVATLWAAVLAFFQATKPTKSPLPPQMA